MPNKAKEPQKVPTVDTFAAPSNPITGEDDDDIANEQIDLQARTESPVKLMLDDLKTLLQNAKHAPKVLLPRGDTAPLPGVEQKLPRTDTVVNVLLVFIEISGLFVFLPTFLLFPGWLFVIVWILFAVVVRVLAGFTWGPLTFESLVPDGADRFGDEEWIFINGIATSYASAKKTCDSLAVTFGRRVSGIHNRSWGIIGDVIECIIQRSFNYSTLDVRIAYHALKRHLKDDSKKRVVVIAHSQGGILISMVLDRLYTELPAVDFKKLEVYTFGSAAKVFNNPLTTEGKMARCDHSRTPTGLTTNGLVNGSAHNSVNGSAAASPVTPAPYPRPEENAQLTMTPQDKDTENHKDKEIEKAKEEQAQKQNEQMPDRLIPYIEHYCNEYDIVPRWGVLHHIIRSTPTTYSGRVFMHEKQSGHLFNNHYLGRMFPLAQRNSTDEHLFPNHIVEYSKRKTLLRAETIHHPHLHPNDSEANCASSSASPSLPPAKAIDGKELKVKELSRLWKYIDGGSP